MFSASKMYINFLFNIEVWLRFGQYDIMVQDKRPVGARKLIVVLEWIALVSYRGDKVVKDGTKN